MMITPWKGRLTAGRLVRRRHRFLLDVVLNNGRSVVAHCVNPGRMEGLIRPGAKVWLSSATGPKRNLEWVWELVQLDGILVCANSWSANKLVKVLLEEKSIRGFKRYGRIDEEVKLGLSARIDFELVSAESSHFIEVKSVQQVYGDGVSYFPDSKVIRSRAHIEVLLDAVNDGHKATLLAVVQRKDAKTFRLSEIHDPKFASALRDASKKGLKVRAILLEPTLAGFKYCGDLPVELEPYELQEERDWYEGMKQYSGWTRTDADPDASWRKKVRR